MPYHDDGFDDLHPAEFPDEEADDDTTPCPNCRASIYEGSEQCPACGHYLTEEGPGRRPWWIIVGLALALAMAFGWALGG